MTDLKRQITGDLEDWIAMLAPYQRTQIEAMLATSEPLDVATAWLEASGPQDTAPFGAVRRSGELFFDSLLSEMKGLFCGDLKYEKQRSEISQADSGARLFLVGIITTSLAPHVGAAAAVIAPAIILILAVLSNATTNSICSALGELIDSRKEAP